MCKLQGLLSRQQGDPRGYPPLCSLEGLRDACMAQPRPRREEGSRGSAGRGEGGVVSL